MDFKRLRSEGYFLVTLFTNILARIDYVIAAYRFAVVHSFPLSFKDFEEAPRREPGVT